MATGSFATTLVLPLVIGAAIIANLFFAPDSGWRLGFAMAFSVNELLVALLATFGFWLGLVVSKSWLRPSVAARFAIKLMVYALLLATLPTMLILVFSDEATALMASVWCFHGFLVMGAFLGGWRFQRPEHSLTP